MENICKAVKDILLLVDMALEKQRIYVIKSCIQAWNDCVYFFFFQKEDGINYLSTYPFVLVDTSSRQKIKRSQIPTTTQAVKTQWADLDGNEFSFLGKGRKFSKSSNGSKANTRIHFGEWNTLGNGTLKKVDSLLN